MNCCPNGDFVPCPKAVCKMPYAGRRVVHPPAFVMLTNDVNPNVYHEKFAPQSESHPDIATHPRTPTFLPNVLYMWNYRGDILTCPWLDTVCFIAKKAENFASWHDFAGMNLPRKSGKGVLINGAPWVIGGNERSTIYYDADADQWKTGPKLPMRLANPISDHEALIIAGQKMPGVKQKLVHKMDTNAAAGSDTVVYPALPATTQKIAAVKFTLPYGQEAVITLGGEGFSDGRAYRSDLPDGAWYAEPAMAVGTAGITNVFCSAFPDGEFLCAFTRELAGEAPTQIHRFDPNGPPFWIKMPFEMPTTQLRVQTTIYVHRRKENLLLIRSNLA